MSKIIKLVCYVMIGFSGITDVLAQAWPNIYLTNGIHNTSYGVEIYDPATTKNLYINPTAILEAGGTELDDIFDSNQVFLNGGTVNASAIDEPDFTWNSGLLNLNGGTHLTTYGLNSGTGKILNIGAGAILHHEIFNSLPIGNQLYLGAGRLSVSNFNASVNGFSLYGSDIFPQEAGILEVSGVLSEMPEYHYDSSVSVILNGNAARWDLDAERSDTMGRSITVKNGGTLTGSADNWRNSVVAITGGGSMWNAGFLKMNSSSGNITISDGGQLLSTGISLGEFSGQQNKVVVTGEGSLWDSGNIYMGYSTSSGSSIVITNGGQVLSAEVLIGDERSFHNQAVVSGSTSQWKVSGNLIIGSDSESNNLTIENGGYVESASAFIGTSVISNWRATRNKVKVSGRESFWHNSGQITIGNALPDDYGNSLTIEGGGTVRTGGVVVNGTQNSLNLNSGGRLEIGTDFNASMTGFNFNSGSELSVEGQLSGLSNLESGRRLETPDLLGDLTVHGIFAPGTSPADSIVDGALTIASDGTLEMELAGYALGAEYDRLSITGFSTLDGLLDIVSLGGFSATNGASFDLFNWDGGVSGEFSAISTDALAAGQSWDTSELYTTGQLSVIPEPGSIGLLGLGSGILLFTRRHRRRRGASGTPAIHTAKLMSCDSFVPPAEVIAMHRRDFWDLLIELDRMKLSVKANCKSTSLHCLDAFLALLMK